MAKPKVMVALRDAEHVEGLTKLACQMSKEMGADLTALNVVEVTPSLPLDAESEVLDQPGKQVLLLARKVAAENSYEKIATRLVRAREAGEAIASEVNEQKADLLIIGYHRPHGVAEALLGSTVGHVARHAPCRIIVQIAAKQ